MPVLASQDPEVYENYAVLAYQDPKMEGVCPF